MTSGFQPVGVAHPGTLLGPSATLPVTVETPADAGAWAVTFPPVPGDDGDGGVDRPFGVAATVIVERGRIGIACLGRDGVTVIDEACVDAGGWPVTVELLADAPGTTGALGIRNAASDGASRATILDVRAMPVPVDDTWPVPLSEPPVMPGWSRYYGSLGAGLAEKARVRRYQRLKQPITLTWTDGLRFRVTPSDQLSRVVYVSGTYEPNTLRLVRAWLAPGSVFVDVGANAGVMSLAASSWVGSQGRIVSIEPSAREFRRLVEHVALNDLRRVLPVRAAVTAVAGERTLRVAAAPRGGLNTLGDRFAYPEMPTEGFEIVDARPLDRILAEAGVDHVNVIKLDVEGSEAEALDGAAETLRAQRPALVIEVCAAALAASGSSVEALAERLRRAEYACFEIDDTTGALQAVATLSGATDRNVAALPTERAPSLLGAARRSD